MKRKMTIVCITIIIIVGIGVSVKSFQKNAEESLIQTDLSLPATQDYLIVNSKTASSPAGEILSMVPHAPGKLSNIEEYERVTKYGKLPHSLQGTKINGELAVDEHGKLIISYKICSLFEYFLSGQNEEGLDTSIARIEEYIKLTLPESAAQEALNIFYSYMNYKKTI